MIHLPYLHTLQPRRDISSACANADAAVCSGGSRPELQFWYQKRDILLTTDVAT